MNDNLRTRTISNLTLCHLDQLAESIRNAILDIDPEATFELCESGIKVTSTTKVLAVLEDRRPDLCETYKAVSPHHRRYVWRMIAAIPLLKKLDETQ